MRYEQSIIGFTVKAVIGAVLVSLFAIAVASAQDVICDNNPQAPQCIPALRQPAPSGTKGFAPTPNYQPAPEQSEMNAVIERQRHACEVRAQRAHDECVQAGRAYCPVTDCN
jgi:hypothetical protein